MKRNVALAAVATVALLPVTACGADSQSAAGVFTTIDGTHAINVNAPINPYNQESNAFTGYNSMQLAWPKNDLTDPNKFYPAIASSWDVAPDQSSVTVTIQPNAKWSDGADVTGDDLKVSAAVSFTQGGGAFATSPGAAGGLGDVSVLDAKHVKFSQGSGVRTNTFLRNILSMWVLPKSVYGPQLPADFWDTLKTATTVGAPKDAQSKAQDTITALGKKLVAFGPAKDVSAGPFALERVNPGEALLVKNRYYFGADKIAPAKVVIRNYSGNEQIWNYLIGGQLDAAPFTATPADVVTRIKARAGNKVITGYSPVSASLAFNQSVQPFGNVHVRRGIAYLIDRAQVAKVAAPVSGTAAATTSGLHAKPAQVWLGDQMSQLNPYSVDRAKAEQEFTAAGLKKVNGKWTLANGKPFTVNIQVPAPFSDWVTAAKSMSGNLTDDGIDSAPVTTADYPTYLKEIAAGKYPVAMWLVALGPSTYNAYQRLYGAANGWKIFGGTLVHKPAGPTTGNWMGGAEKATVPGLGEVDPGQLTFQLSQLPPDAQKPIVAKLAQYTNDQLPVIQMWDYVNVQFVNTSHFTNFPAADSDVLRLSPGVWMQLGYITKK